jgi:hypothetical protein
MFRKLKFIISPDISVQTKNTKREREKACRWNESCSTVGGSEGRQARGRQLQGRRFLENLCSFFPWPDLTV